MKYGNTDPRAKGIYCYIQDRNVFWRDNALQCQHCGKAKKSIDHLATVVIGCLAMTIREGIMRYLGVFNFYLRITTTLKNQKNYDIIHFRRSWKMKEPKFGSIQG
ncbi:hypothetical protein TCON_0367 [Astathelohania contejeani]|uniref:Uncharacterized protein n=1 Tax=Astathelohania contejeani TaxID=164912 RepID=A0ABQ7I1Y2_9MICR|nr:hypothetical protein TCON_0367 [Thelohania contejeani]